MIRSLLIATTALFLSATPVPADVVYEYAGNAFTSFTGACQGDCAISIVLGLPAVLPANVPTSSSPSLSLGAHPWTLSDGQTTIDANQPGHQGAIWIFSTDTQGLPTEWNVWVEDVSGPMGSAVRVLSSVRCLSSHGCLSNLGAHSLDSMMLRDPTYQASSLDAPGTWRMVSVSEPATLLLVGLGILVAGPMTRLRRSPRRRPAGARAG